MATSAPQTLLKNDHNLLDWLQLARSENVGPLTFHHLLKRYGTPAHALEALPDLAAHGGLKRPLKITSRSEVEKELAAIHAFGAELLTLENPLYPPLLRHIDSAPPLLTVKGRLDLLHQPLFAIVGARNASAMGKKMAHKLATELGRQGWTIASGLARGIDTAAHQGSLQKGTIAILAGGIDHIYPQENEELYAKIAEEGVLVAESPFGTQPQATLFPKRNRIISGLSQCVLVVEVALKSGSLITAKYALDQGREVFAIPGHPLDPRANGCNQLIKNGAILVETIQDIEQEISPTSPLQLQGNDNVYEASLPSASLDTVRHLLNENLSFVPINVDEVIRECQLQASDVWVVLLEMEIAGRLERHPGGKVSLTEEWKSE